MLGSRGVNQQSTWKWSTKTLQGLPLHLWPVLILGGLIDSQLGKDLQRLCKDYPLTVLIQGVNQWSTWKGPTKTLQGWPLTMFIWGKLTINLERICERLCNDYLWQYWSWGWGLTVNLERICEDLTRITSAPLTSVDPGGVGWSINSQLGKDPQSHLQWLPLTAVDPWGSRGLINSQLGKDLQRLCNELPLHLWPVLIPGGLSINSQPWKGSV